MLLSVISFKKASVHKNRAEAFLKLIIKFAELTSNGQRALTFLDVAHDLSVDVEALADVDDLLGILGTDIDLQAVAAVEDLVHLAPVSTALLGDDAEEGRHGEHVVPDVQEPHNLRTRRIGSRFAIEVHVRMDGQLPLHAVHERATTIEHKLKERFGADTHVTLHMEPIKK